MPTQIESQAERDLSRDAFQCVFLPLRRLGVDEAQAFVSTKFLDKEGLASALAPGARPLSLEQAQRVIKVNPGLLRGAHLEMMPEHERIVIRTSMMAARIALDTATAENISVESAKAELAAMETTAALNEVEQFARADRRIKLLSVVTNAGMPSWDPARGT